MRTLSVVATPIGNLEDITLRALRTLKEADLILCEDTRVTKKLLARYEITAPLKRLDAHVEERLARGISALFAEYPAVALVSDAGTPGISDPGARFVAAARTHGVAVVPIPGPSAVLAALSASGFPSSDFLFLGFLPHKKGREKLIREVAASERTVVLYESPHRILKTLRALTAALGEGRSVAVCRELTKIHEEFVLGTPAEALVHFEENPGSVRGEFVVIVSGA